ncbi:FkbM family methyltransferase [Polaribacter aquimarinus]|uniref:Methyltransferase FkbM domain-containing protein n=1 Tax=Polaribacter aquimarinus TaxID=2100726 RepID=A0A2U2JAC3_9FLAO|nr:FkbM family methyltransferase [Polaribacter aquimarinus]PWG05288.1 hypothetical protein DIS07_08610 [Polaribacter aquimarinus]
MKLELHEKVLTNLFNINNNLTFFDIGACEGLSSVRYLNIFKKSNIYAFEPIPNNFSKVLKNKNKYNLDNLHPHEIGLSSRKGTATFYVSSGKPPNRDTPDDNSTDFGNKSSSLFKPGKTKEVHPWLEFKESITIKTNTLENFCSEKKVKTIDFIHMDVQGAELMVLQGANSMLKNVKSIWLEVEKVPLYEGQALKSDIEEFLINNNFKLILSKVNHIAGDQFWVRQDYFDKLSHKTKSHLNSVSKKVVFKSNLSSVIGKIKDSIKKK